jgi:hypothetical protein
MPSTNAWTTSAIIPLTGASTSTNPGNRHYVARALPELEDASISVPVRA